MQKQNRGAESRKNARPSTGSGHTDRPLTPEEKWERATIANNFIFYKVMRNNPDICRELLEILLEFKIDRIEMSQEEEIETDFESKGLRLDVYAKDADGEKAYNIEMQATDTKELAERARYYQGAIDVDLLKSGQRYRELKTSFIIFICATDIFKKGRAKYTFENLCVEEPKIKMGDRTQKLFFICANCDILLDARQKAFLRMVAANESSDGFTRRIRTLVQDAKRNTQWRRQYMDWEREKTYARDAGIEEGIALGVEKGIALGEERGARQKTEEDARNLLKMNVLTVGQIAQATGLPLEQVRQLEEELAAEPV